ncbi:MAG: AAA family ATPase [Alkalibacterium sp.]|nr:AAA family ATPase [Alkalibacterium sp.]
MKQIKLLSMEVRNFKGFKEFKLDAAGNDLKVYGDNATGKSTIFDAFSWALFGKDSHDSANFSWKPLDKNNKEVNHLETEVELVLNIDGTDLKLARTVTEKWTRKRGSDSESFEGHQTEYRLDGIKTTKAKYMKKIEEVISEDTFKQLTNVSYVAETMKSKDRRDLLFSLVEELTDQEVIDSKKELKPLEAILDGRSVDDKRQLITEEKRSVKKDLDRTPDRIDEVDRSLPDLSGLDQDALNKELKELADKIQAKEKEIASFSNGGRVTNLRTALQTKTAELQTARSEYQLKQNESVGKLQEQKQVLFDQAMDANNAVKDKESEEQAIMKEIESAKKESESITVKLAELRDSFKQVKGETYPEFDEHKATCSLCGQDYPEDKQAEMKENYEKEKAEFNSNKAAKLEAINAEGKELKATKDSLDEEIQEKEKVLTVKSDMHKLVKVRDDLKRDYEEIKENIESIKSEAEPFESSIKYNSLKMAIDKLKTDIKALQESADEQLQEKEEELAKLRTAKESIQDDLYQFKQVEKQEARKQELIAEEKRLSARYGELENQLYLLDEFVRTKVSLLTDRINNQFDLVEFKLFEEQINGGLKEVCEPLVEGVPFSSGLNTAARINAGLDIINTLSRLEGVSAPIFIDNSESITKLIETEAQTIQLIVTEGQQELKIETKTLEGVA